MLKNAKIGILFTLFIVSLLQFSMAGPSLPPSALYYVPINISNTQTTATGAGFQQLLTINMSKYKTYLRPKLNNTAFYYYNGTKVYSWIESNLSNASKYTDVWVKLNPSVVHGTNLTIYMAIGNMTSNYINATTSGIAPELTPTYGSYDNGRNVFNVYDNFKGTALNTSLWKDYLGTGASITINNKLVITQSTSSEGSAMIYSKINYTVPQIFDVFTLPFSNNGQYVFMGESTTNSSYTVDPSLYDLYGIEAGGAAAYVLRVEGSSGSITTYSGSGGLGYSKSVVYSMIWPAQNVEYAYLNYSNKISPADVSFTLPSKYFYQISSLSTQTAGNMSIQWARSRNYPPNDVMPTVGYGPITSTSSSHTVTISITPSPDALLAQTVTVTATCSAGDTCEVQSPLGTTLASGTTTATYTTSSLTFGSHTFYGYNVAGSTDASASVDIVAYIVSKKPTLSTYNYETSTDWFNYTINFSPAVKYANVIVQNALKNLTYENETGQAKLQNYNMSYILPLVSVNNTANIYNSSFVLVYNNNTKIYYSKVLNNSQNTYFNYIPAIANKLSNIIEGDNQTIFVNISQKKLISLATVNSTVVIGNKTLTEFVSSNYHYYASIYSFLNKNFNLVVPKVGFPVTVTSNVSIKLTYNNNYVWRNSTVTFGSYLPSLINCNSTSDKAINWTFYNATQPSQLWTANVLLQGSFIIRNQLYTSNTINGTNAGFTTTATSNKYYTCIYPNFASFISGGSFKYSSVGATNATFYLQNLSTSNKSTTEKLYLYNISSPILYEVAVENVTSASYIPALVQVDLYNPNTNTSILVNEFYTQGGSGTYINLQDQRTYRFVAYTPQTNNLLAVTNYFTAQSCGTSACPFVIQVGNFSISLIQSTLANLKYNCNTTPQASNTATESCIFTSNLGNEYNISLKVYNQSGYSLTSQVPVCSKSETTKSGTLSCAVSRTNDTLYVWKFNALLNGTSYTLAQGTFGTAQGIFGNIGVFITLLGVIVVSLIFITKNPTITIIGADLYLTALFYINVIQGTLLTVGFLWIGSAFIIYIINRR